MEEELLEILRECAGMAPEQIVAHPGPGDGTVEPRDDIALVVLKVSDG